MSLFKSLLGQVFQQGVRVSESAVSVSSSLRRADSSRHVLRLEVTLMIVPKPVQGSGGELVIQKIRRQTILDQIVEGEPW